jgi:nitrogen PTS system EIIA component
MKNRIRFFMSGSNMKSLINALKAGRLIELPDADKDKSLHYLATLIEAIPDFKSGFDFSGAVAARERAANTAIGAGWACPHGRVPGEGDLACAVGWSPAGIDWGAPDGKPVHIVIMNYIPDSEKNAYLKEISTLAKAIQTDPGLRAFHAEQDLSGVRLRLIDALTAAAETTAPDAKARMIRLEARQAAAVPAPAAFADLAAAAEIIPLSVVIAPGVRPVALSQHLTLTAEVEKAPELPRHLAAKLPFDLGGYRILIHSVTAFQPDRFLYACIAVKLANVETKR